MEKESNTLISVIIPVYNAQKYLSECVESVMGQTHENIEILLIDDGSSDGSGAICDAYAEKDSRIRVIHKENGGVSSARNCGLELAVGEYITFVDSDDSIEPTCIEKLYLCAVRENNDISLCGLVRYYGNNRVVAVESIPDCLTVDVQNSEFLNFFGRYFSLDGDCLFGSVWRTLYRADLLRTVRFNESIKISEDLIFFLNGVLYAKKLGFIADPLYRYRINEELAGGFYKKNYLQGQVALMKEIRALFARVGSPDLNKKRDTYLMFLCHWCFTNEIKFRGRRERKQSMREIRHSELYDCYRLSSVLSIRGAKARIKTLIVWFLVKTHLV